jgi:hypothetical protein
MHRGPKSDRQTEFESKGSAGSSGDGERGGWSRREFLTNSTGLAVAGAIGGRAGTVSLSVRNRRPRVRPSHNHPQSRPHPEKRGASLSIRTLVLTTRWLFF